MAEKNLPIKFFQKRQKDDVPNQGGGDRKLPKWANPKLVGEKATYIRNVLSQINASFQRKVRSNNYVPSVIKVKLNEDALTKSPRKEIGNFFNLGKLNIIGMVGLDELLVKIDNEKDLQTLITRFAKINVAYPSFGTVVGISAITDVEEYKPQVSIESTKEKTLKVKLFNYGNSDLNTIVTRVFENFCNENNIQYDKSVYSAELNIYKISQVAADSFEVLKDFDGVQFITEMPTYEVAMDEVSSEKIIPIKEPIEGKSYPIVGVLDTGIASIPHLAPWIHEKNFTKYHEDDIDKRHGTFVAGVLSYGDDLQGENYTSFEGCKLFEAIVMPDTRKQKIYEDELIEHIREAIAKNDEIKIWNLSLGSKTEADLYEFSDFAKALDEIQEHHNVLIVTSAGNCDNFARNAPVSRISRSADTIRGIVVGSIAQDKNATDIAEKHTPSPFSRIGPGPYHLIKPDVAHIGGNAGLNKRNNLISNPTIG